MLRDWRCSIEIAGDACTFFVISTLAEQSQSYLIHQKTLWEAGRKIDICIFAWRGAEHVMSLSDDMSHRTYSQCSRIAHCVMHR